MKITDKEKELLRKLLNQCHFCNTHGKGCHVTNEEISFLCDSLSWAEREEEEDFYTRLDRCIDNLSAKEIEVLEQNFRIRKYQATPKELNYNTASLRDKIREWNIDPISLIEIENQEFDFADEFFAIQWTEDKTEPVIIYSWNEISQDFYDYCDEHKILPTAFKD